MRNVAVLTPAVLLLLMVLLGRLERWLDDATGAVPTRAERRRWRRTPRSVRSAASVQVPASRRRLAHRNLRATRRRTAAGARPESVVVPPAARRHLLGGRVRLRGR